MYDSFNVSFSKFKHLAEVIPKQSPIRQMKLYTLSYRTIFIIAIKEANFQQKDILAILTAI